MKKKSTKKDGSAADIVKTVKSRNKKMLRRPPRGQ
jgi:hypothetical protein